MEAWNEFKTSQISESMSYITTSQFYLSISILAFSLVGRQLFKLQEEYSSPDDPMEEMKSMMDGLMQSENPTPKTEKELEKERKEKERKQAEKEKMAKIAEEKEKMMSIVHTEFFNLLFDVMKQVMEKFLLPEVVGEIGGVIGEIDLKTKFNAVRFEEILEECS